MKDDDTLTIEEGPISMVPKAVRDAAVYLLQNRAIPKDARAYTDKKKEPKGPRDPKHDWKTGSRKNRRR